MSTRAQEARLESILERLDAAERRALADLRTAGYRFVSVKSARQYLAALRTTRRRIAEQGMVFTPEQLAIAVAVVERSERRG